MSSVRVSIIVPCYNHAQFLSEALQSVLNQSYSNWECIIINDGSLDNTEKVAEQWLIKDSRFKYIKKDNGGLSSARNAGIAVAVGDYIVTLDSDDKYEMTFIEKATSILNNKLEIGVVSSWGIRFFKNKYYDIFKPIGGTIDNFLFSNASIGTAMFRKKCWEDCGGYDEEMLKGYEDWEFYIRVAMNGWQTEIIKEPLFYYRQHKSSMRVKAVSIYDKEIRFYIFTKHKDLYIKYYDQTIENLLSNIDLNKKNELKRINSIDFKIGKLILKPFRFIKKSFK